MHKLNRLETDRFFNRSLIGAENAIRYNFESNVLGSIISNPCHFTESKYNRRAARLDDFDQLR